ncbi:hypothetical protein [Micromonospora sp. WMMD964]|uniref:hypothetical protein n=1 Tax=Micromonospora sp. WMMD964 TaxID=3016091 RepID=UPI00249C4809|nr:hypothetical protein [Micromonospora sp. WMMD964]WFE98857.1 hypothetical protein O7616_18285 [Micromonospora sp. WMMD964]
MPASEESPTISEDHQPERGADETDIEEFVASCPIGAELADQLVGLADLPWHERAVTGPAMRSLGWSTAGVPTDEARFVTPAGHAVYTDYGLYLPFVHYYVVGGELWPDDFWGSQPGWTSERGAGRVEFEAYLDAGIDRFAERLGPPECDIRTEGRHLAIGRYSWRYAAWRRAAPSSRSGLPWTATPTARTRRPSSTSASSPRTGRFRQPPTSSTCCGSRSVTRRG